MNTPYFYGWLHDDLIHAADAAAMTAPRNSGDSGIPHNTWNENPRAELESIRYAPQQQHIRFGHHGALIVLLPTQDITKLNQSRVQHYKQQLNNGVIPTVLAFAHVHVTSTYRGSPWVQCEQFFVYTCYILDGHHRMMAAAQIGRPMQVLAFTLHSEPPVVTTGDTVENPYQTPQYRDMGYYPPFLLHDRMLGPQSLWPAPAFQPQGIFGRPPDYPWVKSTTPVKQRPDPNAEKRRCILVLTGPIARNRKKEQHWFATEYDGLKAPKRYRDDTEPPTAQKDMVLCPICDKNIPCAKWVDHKRHSNPKHQEWESQQVWTVNPLESHLRGVEGHPNWNPHNLYPHDYKEENSPCTTAMQWLETIPAHIRCLYTYNYEHGWPDVHILKKCITATRKRDDIKAYYPIHHENPQFHPWDVALEFVHEFVAVEVWSWFHLNYGDGYVRATVAPDLVLPSPAVGDDQVGKEEERVRRDRKPKPAVECKAVASTLEAYNKIMGVKYRSPT
eukprot:TRINITY_DN66758_c4_g1_i5.p1 TRINITY_DN66758_c4_g1~~TRINITY_DN66758_c4_g1_i5.p1  ORF type:complete len:502 (-),score=60.48 TRINITY_DN66758_c4_g1_i5:125-1630(-)